MISREEPVELDASRTWRNDSRRRVGVCVRVSDGVSGFAQYELISQVDQKGDYSLNSHSQYEHKLSMHGVLILTACMTLNINTNTHCERARSHTWPR